jgi:hypothetical protein
MTALRRNSHLTAFLPHIHVSAFQLFPVIAFLRLLINFLSLYLSMDCLSVAILTAAEAVTSRRPCHTHTHTHTHCLSYLSMVCLSVAIFTAAEAVTSRRSHASFRSSSRAAPTDGSVCHDRIRTDLCVCVCVCVYVCVCMCMCMYVYVCSDGSVCHDRIRTDVCVCVCMHIYIYIYTHTHIHIHTRTHKLTHEHTQAHPKT